MTAHVEASLAAVTDFLFCPFMSVSVDKAFTLSLLRFAAVGGLCHFVLTVICPSVVSE